MRFLFLFLVAVQVVLTYAGCQQKNVYVKNGSELKNLLLTNIDIGTNIILTPGETYSIKDNNGFLASFIGKIDCPIVLKTDDRGISNGYATVASAFSLLTRSQYAVFSNVRFTGGPDATAVAYSKNILFENVYFSGSDDKYGTGMMIEGAVSNLTFNNCTFEKNSFAGFFVGYAIGQAAISVSFEQCRFVDNGLKDVQISAGNAISFAKCSFEGDPSVAIYWNEDDPCDIHDNIFKTTTKQTEKSPLYFMRSLTNGVRNNTFYMESGIAILSSDKEKMICASNKVYGGATLTNAKVDDSC